MKKRFIACVVACAMLLMGTGYAYWTDLINLSATAETGFLDVDFTGTDIGENNFTPISGGLTSADAYHTAAASEAFVETDPDSVSFGITDLFPGHYQEYTTTAGNFGTVAAKLGKVKLSISGSNDATKNMIGIMLTAKSTYTTEDTTTQVPKYNVLAEICYKTNCNKHFDHEWLGIIRFGKFYGTRIIGYDTVPVEGQPTTNPVDIDFDEDDTFTIGNSTFIRLSALEGKSISIDEAISNMLYLTNDSSMEFSLAIGMDPDAEGDFTTGSAALGNPKGNYDVNTQNATAYVNFGLVWDQYNEQ